MMRAVHLHGRLRKQFGPSFRFDVDTAAEALRALNCAFPGEFAAALSIGSYSIVRGDKRSGARLDFDLVSSLRLGLADLHVIPVAEGAANGKGVAKTIVGAALVGGAIFFSGGTLAAPLTIGSATTGLSWASVAAVGIGVALNGAASLMSKAQNTQEAEKEDSHTINGPSNGGKQGEAIQLIYGEVITGSVNVSFDANIEDIGAYAGQTASLGNAVQAIPDGAGGISFLGGGA